MLKFRRGWSFHLKGYSGKLLYINLTTNSSIEKTLTKDFAEKYLGGLGFASRLLYNELKPGIDPLSPENCLIIAPGLLVGSGIPTASKTVFVAKSPLTLGFGRAVAGASLGVSLKKAGYDALIIKGKSVSPTILIIDNGKVSFEDGLKLWGLNVRETNKELRKRYEGFTTAVIGPAGEHLSKIASIDCEERQAARTGLGAVMGSKNLKAIAVKGDKEIEYADLNLLKELIKKWSKILKSHPASVLDLKFGTAEFYEWVNLEKGVFPSRNWQQGYFQKSYDNLNNNEKSKLDPYYWAPKYTFKNRACPGCNKPCGRIFKVNEGKYAGVEVDGLEYEVIYALGGSLEIDDPEAVAYLNLICDLLGLDAISAGLTLAWAMEANEKGLLNNEELKDLKFGNVEAAAETLRKMAYKDGEAGNLLSDGSKIASEKLGKNSNKFAMHSKGLELPAYDVRGLKGAALAFAVSVRGGCHLTGVVYGTELSGKWWKFSNVNRFSPKEKGFEVKIHEDIMTIYDILGICKFSRHMFFIEGLPELVAAVTGFNFSISSLVTIGERVYNIQRAFNAREGFTRKDDNLPERVFSEPIPKGKSKGSVLTREEFEKMLDEYYAARGWSINGIPTKAKLTSLDLLDIAEEVGV
ncbi:MAG: aldehyde ferredoxin oxidoreductase family protein [Candidatus Bathyarchaeia archaeon]